ncbi:hypothetical protein SAMN05660772_01314 [Pasteurella testudinis DSM 23072]|uniref:Uncharacterized protein n=1 Tax=Pasteurella testudinis DSM 23072 TaxID=1122938 RepID=A0A1W1V7D6_9PAST|nr:hypothetical protein SAMN05660772_01314 [Pasteurella testudinis DSM 23072]
MFVVSRSIQTANFMPSATALLLKKSFQTALLFMFKNQRKFLLCTFCQLRFLLISAFCPTNTCLA